jgi:hypothetical protein
MHMALSDAEKQLASFVAKYTPEIAARAQEILSSMRTRYPNATELVYDNYNALAIGFGPTERASDAIFSIALYPKWVSLFFLQAKGLKDPHGLLQGSGSVARHIRLPSPGALDDPHIRELMRDAVAAARIPFDPQAKHRLVIKSVSAAQRPRRPPEKKAKAVAKPATGSA